MPTYDYICKKCEKMVEYFQCMSDAPKKECPDCKENSLRRVISGGTGLIFKGSGYYLTDYKNKKNKPPEKKDTGKKKKKETSKKKIES